MNRWIAVGATAMAMAVVAFVLTSGPPAALPTAPGTFAFAVLGDAPYYPWEELKYRVVRQDLEQHELAFVIHVGDIFWRPCSDRRMRKSLDQFEALRHPVIYTPGDNEWADCWASNTGGFAPLERLAALRRIFFADPSLSLGARRLPLEHQGDQHAEFVEHARWSHDGVVFATVNLPGSRNAMQAFDGRTAEDDEAAVARTAAAAAWLRETFAAARAGGARAVVIAFHANPGLERPPEHDYRRSYDPFLASLEEGAAAFAGPVLVVHGDNHDFLVDQPLTIRSTGDPLANVTRMQVPGSPEVGWVRVAVGAPAPTATFAFEPRVTWKYW